MLTFFLLTIFNIFNERTTVCKDFLNFHFLIHVYMIPSVMCQIKTNNQMPTLFMFICTLLLSSKYHLFPDRWLTRPFVPPSSHQRLPHCSPGSPQPNHSHQLLSSHVIRFRFLLEPIWSVRTLLWLQVLPIPTTWLRTGPLSLSRTKTGRLSSTRPRIARQSSTRARAVHLISRLPRTAHQNSTPPRTEHLTWAQKQTDWRMQTH